MEADHQNLQRPSGRKLVGAGAEQSDQLAVDNLYHLLAGGDPLEHVLPDALLLDAFDEVSRDLEIDVGGEQGGADLLEGFRHVFFGQFADPAEVAQG